MGAGVGRLALRFMPIGLAGCTLLSGVTAFEIGPVSSDAGIDVAPSVTEGPAQPEASTTPDASVDVLTTDDADADEPKDPDAQPEPEPDAAPFDGGVDSGTPPTTATFTGTLGYRTTKQFGPFPAKYGTLFEARTNGIGDPDLYLRFGTPPSLGDYDCRSHGATATEYCGRTVPDGKAAYVMVYAYGGATYTLTATYRPGP